MSKTTQFSNTVLAYFLILPQLIVTVIFFIWPGFTALQQSFFRGDAFGIHKHFVWFENFSDLFVNPRYLYSLWVTLIFSVAVAVLSMSSGLLLAALVNGIKRGSSSYKSMLIWPYAVAPAVSAILFRFLFNPSIGVISFWLNQLGYEWNYILHAHQALFLVVLASSWQQFSYNFLFFLAGLQAIPRSLIEAAAIDGAGPFRRFWNIVFPLLSPTTFFLLVINLIYAFFDTFGVIQIISQGGPASATNTLVYKVYNDGFIGLDIGGSAAQSVILMIIVITLTAFQFRYIERKVHY